MNKNFFNIVFLLTVTFIPLKAYAQPAQFKKVINDVSHFIETKNQSDKAIPGEIIFNGDNVSTGKRSFASIFFTDDKSVLIVRENSSLEIFGKKEGDNYAKSTSLNKGELNFHITKRQDQDFIFTTPTALASIRGTTGIIKTFPNNSTLIYIDTGLVEVNALLGNKQSGNVGTGMFAMIDSSGNINVSSAPDSVKKEYSYTKSNETKKVIIHTDHGDIIIEYLINEEKH
jgi:FecR protein